MPRDEQTAEELLKVGKIERAMAPGRGDTYAREMTEDEVLERAFMHHPPDLSQQRAYASIRAAGRALALVILQSTPKCADRTAAVRKVREAVMTANAAVALEGLI